MGPARDVNDDFGITCTNNQHANEVRYQKTN